MGKKSVSQIFNDEFFHPLEREAFILGVLMGVMESRYKIYIITNKGATAIDRPGLMLAEKALFSHEGDLREGMNKFYSVRKMFAMLKTAMERRKSFLGLHKFIRLTERAYKKNWCSEEFLSRIHISIPGRDYEIDNIRDTPT